MRRLAPAVLLFILGCANAPQRCDTLYFGTGKPDGSTVTASEWDAFRADTITPRFPGLTEWDADGYWKGKPERTHIVFFILHGAADDAAIAQIIDAYKKRFQQESVLRVSSQCRTQFR